MRSIGIWRWKLLIIYHQSSGIWLTGNQYSSWILDSRWIRSECWLQYYWTLTMHEKLTILWVIVCYKKDELISGWVWPIWRLHNFDQFKEVALLLQIIKSLMLTCTYACVRSSAACYVTHVQFEAQGRRIDTFKGHNRIYKWNMLFSAGRNFKQVKLLVLLLKHIQSHKQNIIAVMKLIQENSSSS